MHDATNRSPVATHVHGTLGCCCPLALSLCTLQRMVFKPLTSSFNSIATWKLQLSLYSVSALLYEVDPPEEPPAATGAQAPAKQGGFPPTPPRRTVYYTDHV